MAKTSNITTVSIPQDMFDRLEHVCRAEKCSRSELLIGALRRYLDNADQAAGNDRFHLPASLWREAAALPWRNAVERRAYSLFEQRGPQEGHEVEDWIQGERDMDTRKGDRRRVSRPVEGDDRRTGVDRRQPVAVIAD
jgi:hypothetical protein